MALWLTPLYLFISFNAISNKSTQWMIHWLTRLFHLSVIKCYFKLIRWTNGSLYLFCLSLACTCLILGQFNVISNESAVRMAHWLKCMFCSLNDLMLLWMNLLNEWLIDSLNVLFSNDSVLLWMHLQNERLIDSLACTCLVLDGFHSFLNESAEWMIHWLTCLFRFGTIQRYFEQIVWMNGSLTYSLV